MNVFITRPGRWKLLQHVAAFRVCVSLLEVTPGVPCSWLRIFVDAYYVVKLTCTQPAEKWDGQYLDRKSLEGPPHFEKSTNSSGWWDNKQPVWVADSLENTSSIEIHWVAPCVSTALGQAPQSDLGRSYLRGSHRVWRLMSRHPCWVAIPSRSPPSDALAPFPGATSRCAARRIRAWALPGVCVSMFQALEWRPGRRLGAVAMRIRQFTPEIMEPIQLNHLL